MESKKLKKLCIALEIKVKIKFIILILFYIIYDLCFIFKYKSLKFVVYLYLLMFNSRYLTILTIFLLLVYSVNSDQLMSADLKNHFTNLGLQLWNNINGLVIKI